MSYWLIALGIIFIIVISILKELNTKKITYKYKKSKLMTNNEIEFYQRIIKGLKEANLTYITYPQIAMSAIIKPENKGKEYYQAFRKISQKRVDFAVYDHQFNPVCIIELDDRTHNTEKDKERDQLLESAGIKTIRYQSKDKPEPQKIAEDVKNIVIV